MTTGRYLDLERVRESWASLQRVSAAAEAERIRKAREVRKRALEDMRDLGDALWRCFTAEIENRIAAGEEGLALGEGHAFGDGLQDGFQKIGAGVQVDLLAIHLVPLVWLWLKTRMIARRGGQA